MEQNTNHSINPEPEPDAIEILPRQRHLPVWVIPVVVLVLALAVFLAFRLINNQPAGNMPDLDGSFISGGPGGQTMKTIKISMDPAPELPKEPSDKNGVFIRRKDNSLFIGTGKMSAISKMGDNGQVDTNVTYDGPVIEIVTTHDTQIYQDVTELKMGDSASAESEQHYQQVVKNGSLDDLGKNSVITVWGNVQGDRIIARVLLFR